MELHLTVSEQKSIAKFMDALSDDDRQILTDLMRRASQHTQALKLVDDAVPLIPYLLVLLIEEHKEVARLRRMIEEFQR